MCLQTSMAEPYTVNGTLEITLDVNQPTLCVVLHASDLNITHAALEDPHTHGEPLCTRWGTQAASPAASHVSNTCMAATCSTPL